MACAPRYQYLYKFSNSDMEYFPMQGHCFTYSGQNYNSNERIKPLENTDLLYGRHGWENNATYDLGTIYGEAGMSFHYDKIGKTKYWGAPGVWRWTGTYAM